MKIRITFDISKEDRRAINQSVGKSGLADRSTIIAEIEGAVKESLNALQTDSENEEDES